MFTKHREASIVPDHKKAYLIDMVHHRSGTRFPFVGLTGESVSAKWPFCTILLRMFMQPNCHFLRVPRVWPSLPLYPLLSINNPLATFKATLQGYLFLSFLLSSFLFSEESPRYDGFYRKKKKQSIRVFTRQRERDSYREASNLLTYLLLTKGSHSSFLHSRTSA